MATFIITGNYTPSAMKGMIANPSDRETAVKALVESTGGKLISYFLTTGENDFLMVVQAADDTDMIAPLIVAGASGSAANLRTVRAYSSAEFLAAQKKAGEIAKAYKPAG